MCRLHGKKDAKEQGQGHVAKATTDCRGSRGSGGDREGRGGTEGSRGTGELQQHGHGLAGSTVVPHARLCEDTSRFANAFPAAFEIHSQPSCART